MKVTNGEEATVMGMCNKHNNIKADVRRDLEKVYYISSSLFAGQ